MTVAGIGGRPQKYDFSGLPIGTDGVLVEGAPPSIAQAAYREAKRLGRKFRTSKQREGVRVWRIA